MRFFLKNWIRFYWSLGVRLFPAAVILYVALFGVCFYQRGGFPFPEEMAACVSVIAGVALAVAPRLRWWNPVSFFAGVFSSRQRKRLLRILWRHCDRPPQWVDIACFALCVVQIGLATLALPKLAEPSEAAAWVFPFCWTVNCWIYFLFCLGFLWKYSAESFLSVYEKKILPFLAIQGALSAPLGVIIVALWRGGPLCPFCGAARFLLDLFCLSIYFTFIPTLSLALLFFVKLVGDFARRRKRKSTETAGELK